MQRKRLLAEAQTARTAGAAAPVAVCVVVVEASVPPGEAARATPMPRLTSSAATATMAALLMFLIPTLRSRAARRPVRGTNFDIERASSCWNRHGAESLRHPAVA